MRSLARGLHDVIAQLRQFEPGVGEAAYESLCQVEVGLRLQERLMRESPAAHAWVLFSGYPFAQVSGVSLPPDSEAVLRAGRYSMWTLRRRRAWREALDRYQGFNRALRGFDVPDPDRPALRRDLSVADDRWDTYDELLRVAPPLAVARLKVAGPGPHAFPVSRTMAEVDLPSVPHAPLIRHDMDALPLGQGERLTFSLEELKETAVRMDAVHYRDWAGRLGKLVLSVKADHGFRDAQTFTVDRIQHLLGIVGAGKSTLRDIIAVHLATGRQKKRVTVVVGDVTEVLKLVKLYNVYTDGAAAPIVGANSRERHAQRLHRRLAGQGEHRLLAHQDQAFDHLGTSCVLNALRGGAARGETLAFGEAPCTRLRSGASRPREAAGRHPVSRWQKQRVSCPYWSVCPRHHTSRALVGADIWVATPAALVDASPPQAQNGERIRYLELACRRSDLVIVDEADRVQMQWDENFAPAVPLAGGDEDGFIDKLSGHKIRELAVGGRVQLSDRDVENFTAALNTAQAATDRLYAMLVADHKLRIWVRTGYFSAWTLQLGLLDERYELPEGDEPADRCRDGADETCRVERATLWNKLDAFRDNPFGDRFRFTKEDFGDLTRLLNEILHTSNPDNTRRRVAHVMDEVFRLVPFMERKQQEYEREYAAWQEKREQWERSKGAGRRGKEPQPPQTPERWRTEFAQRFEFTLLLCALEPKLALINAMWPRVEAALNLGFNTMYSRPVDYGPMVPEAPMGNVIGFQFHVKGQDEGGVRSGELTFFRCSGVGRELLRQLPDLARADDRPGAHVLLMSGSSWAGLSSRYHIAVEVGVIIEPLPEVTRRIAEESLMRFEFIEDGGAPMQVSGTDPDDRPDKLRRIATVLGASVEEEDEGGPLERELMDLQDGRDQILLLVGSYEEARIVADTLHNLNMRWKGRVLRLVSDDEDIEDDDYGDDGHHARVLRRGDVEHLKDCGADILVAPLLAIERGYNILNDNDEAAIGTVYFLARPNPHPDDLSLAVHAINDWIVRAQESGEFAQWVRSGATVADGAEAVRHKARSRWYQVLRRSMAWSRLGDDREQVTWDMLVLMWQVIGRLVRGGVPARVVFVDSAFTPRQAATPAQPDTFETSLLHSVRHVLRPYFADAVSVPSHDQFIVRALYKPLWQMLDRCLDEQSGAAQADTAMRDVTASA
ncbi:pPIWI_RE_Z domain-containing protein [Streptomyces celluloflavus]|uniref:pPIWI_RE_Z domain-containing protein n=1 Tax=Streptomyces celluloflavus TaxID=58344 RepID=UPI0036C70068